MRPRIMTAQIAVAWIEQTPPTPPFRLDDNFSAVGITTAQPRIERAHEQPVLASLWANISKELRRAAGAGHQQIHRSIIIQVAANQAPTDGRLATESRIFP